MKQVMDASMILHNMIVKDEWEEYDINFDFSCDGPSNDVLTPNFNGYHEAFRRYLERRTHMCQKKIHRHLQADLVEHVCEHFGCKK